MVAYLLVCYLAVHGLLHLAIWLPHPQPDPETSPPFRPDHSGVLTAVAVSATTTHTLSVLMAIAACCSKCFTSTPG